MPELPEVQTIVDDIAPRLRRATIVRAELIRPDMVRHGREGFSRLPGSRIESVGREGKRINFLLARPQQARRIRMVIHLGMSGRLYLAGGDKPLAPHTHFRMAFSGRASELRFSDPRRFGGIWLLTNGSDTAANLGQLGPDALTITAATLRRLFDRRRRIKPLLLDQAAISGLGNIYTDEALYRASIHPLAHTSRLTDKAIEALAGVIRQVLREAIQAGGSTLRDYRRGDGSEGRFARLHRVYGREGEPCMRCGSAIRRIAVGGRSTHYCPSCQALGRSGQVEKKERVVGSTRSEMRHD